MRRKEAFRDAHSGFKRGKTTCPVCDRTHRYHCSVTEDGSLALCKYKWSDKQAKDGRFIHALKQSSIHRLSATSATAIKECGNCGNEVADSKRRDEVYRAFLEHPLLLESEENPPLTPAHADHLLNERGLSDTTIAANLYTSIPDWRTVRAICDDLASRFDLRGVAGFYPKDGRWRLNAHGDGFLVPYKDPRGCIVAAQIRYFDRSPKYIWLSSVKYEGGVSSGSPLHFSRTDLVKESGSAFLTEGALKADRISEFKHSACIATAGVTACNPQKLVAEMRHSLPDLRSLTVVYDIDWQEKREVKDALFRLLSALKRTEWKVRVGTWDLGCAKGFDDALAKAEGVAE